MRCYIAWPSSPLATLEPTLPTYSMKLPSSWYHREPLLSNSFTHDFYLLHWKSLDVLCKFYWGRHRMSSLVFKRAQTIIDLGLKAGLYTRTVMIRGCRGVHQYLGLGRNV